MHQQFKKKIVSNKLVTFVHCHLSCVSWKVNEKKTVLMEGYLMLSMRFIRHIHNINAKL